MMSKLSVLAFSIGVFLSGAMFVHADIATTTVTVVIAACGDGIDNDGDLQIDFPDDIGCESATDLDESNPACADGIDNDLDGAIDFPSDPGCTHATDTSEYNVVVTPSGGGSEAPNARGGIQSAPTPTNTNEGEEAQTLRVEMITFPGAVVTLTVDGSAVATTLADEDGRVLFVEAMPTAGTYTISGYSYDQTSVRTPATAATLQTGDTTTLVLAPTLRLGNDIVSGFAPAGSQIIVVIDGVTYSATGGADGEFSVPLPAGAASAYAYVIVGGVQSDNSHQIIIPQTDVPPSEDVCPEVSAADVDYSNDGRVSLIDFSIAAYGFDRASIESRFDLNCSDTVDLTDLSIMAYYWTG